MRTVAGFTHTPAIPTARSSGSSLGRAQAGLVLVGLLFFAVQIILVPRPFGLSTDEVTYLAKVDPAVPELYWTPPRAWGMAVLAAPIAVFSPGLQVIRLYFGLLASVGLVAAFWPWLRVMHPAVGPVAALVFSTTWFTVFFGSLVMPNLYVGLGAVAAVGLFLRAVQAPTWWRTALVGTGAGFIALVRPTDSVLVLAPLFACGLVASRLRRPGVLGAVAVGGLLGWLPWIAEAYLRFGGPLARLQGAESAGPRGLRLSPSNLLIYPRLLDGYPSYCCYGASPAEAGPVSVLFTTWLIALLALALLGLGLSARQHRFLEMLVAWLPAALLAAFYLLLPAFTTLRFLLPVFALLALPVATALIYLPTASDGARRRVATVLVAAVLFAHIAVMLPKAERVLDVIGKGRAEHMRTADALRPIVSGRPCLLMGVGRATSFYLGCSWQAGRPTHRRPPRVAEAQRHGWIVVAVLRKPPPAGSYLASWRPVDVRGLPRGSEAYVWSR